MIGLVNYSSEPHSVELRDLPQPEISEDDVLLAVEAVGVCGSDLHQYSGKQSWKVNYPVVLGHEFGGVIAQTGARVRNFREGDRVVSETAAVLDLDSPFTRAGQYNLDPNRLGFGYGVNGAMTRYVRVPERCLHRVPDGLAFEKAALTEPCCVAYNAVCVNAHIRPGDSVVVIGPGPIGLLCAMMAKLSGASPLIVVGVKADTKRLAVARQIGATHTLGEQGEDVAAAVKALGDGYGVDVVIDAAGVSPTLQLALEIVRPAGQISKVGWGREPLGFSLDPLVGKGVTLRGSFSHNWPMWEKVLAMLASGQLELDLILNRVAPLEDWKSCFDAMHSGDLVKAVLKP
ncbi:MAG TPA: zinc-binding dehydrogenase [Chthoniobacteraceae bacterium]|jgi:L-iditol 2-dehydrogenase|nr:zinc-binding dehydrogenase [Chthoniobacteraceae bacterium]